MDFFKRLGTQRHKFQVQFCLKSLSCKAKIKGDISVQIRRGEHKVVSQNKVTQKQNGTCNFNQQILSFDSLTLFYDTTQKTYQHKQGEVRIIVLTPQGQRKLVGSFQADIAQYVNTGKQTLEIKKQFGNKIKIQLQFNVHIISLGGVTHSSKDVTGDGDQFDKMGRKNRITLMKQIPLFFQKQNLQIQDKQDDLDHIVQLQQQQDKNDKSKKPISYGVVKESLPKKQQTNLDKQQAKKNIKENKPTQAQNEQLKKITQSLKQYQQKYQKIQREKRVLQNQNLRLRSQNQVLKQRERSTNNNRNFYQTQRQGFMPVGQDQRIRQLQSQKGELLVNIQRLQQKYKKDFAKYQQTVSLYQQQRKQVQQSSKAQIKRLKQQLSKHKQQQEQLKATVDQKTKQLKRMKQNQTISTNTLTTAQKNLYQLKVKIGDKLNQANQQKNKPLIDCLALLLQ